MKKLLCLLMVVSLCLSFTGLALAEDDFSLQHLQEMGALTIGTTAVFPPMASIDEKGELVGFDVDLAKAVCSSLGVEFQYKVIQWVDRDAELESRDILCLWDGVSYTDERAQTMELTKPYLNNQVVLVARAGTTLADLAGKTLGVQRDAYPEEVLAREEHAAFRASLAAIAPYDHALDLQQALAAGEIDGVLLDLVVAQSLLLDDGSDYAAIQSFADDQYVVAFHKGDVSLRDAVQQALDELKANGTLAELSIQWFGSDITA